MEKDQTTRVTILIDKDLWRDVSVESAKMGIHKKEFVDMALREKIKRIEEENMQNEDEN